MKYRTEIPRYDNLIKDLPEKQHIIENTTATLLFAGQEWGNNSIRIVDTYRFTVPLSDLYTSDYNRRPSQPSTYDGGWAVNKFGTNSHYVADQFQKHKNAPQPAKHWDGPFEIKLLEWN